MNKQHCLVLDCCSTYKDEIHGGRINDSLQTRVRREASPSNTRPNTHNATRTILDSNSNNDNTKNYRYRHCPSPRSVATEKMMMPPHLSYPKQDDNKLFVLPPALFSKPSPPRIHSRPPTTMIKKKDPPMTSPQTTTTTTTTTTVKKTTRTRQSPTNKYNRTTTTTTSSKALQTLESALKSRSAKYGPHHAKVAQVWNWMGNYHLQQSESESECVLHKPSYVALVQAMDCFRQALSFRKCSQSAEALANIGSVHLKWGNVQRAIGCCQKALSRLRSLQGRQEFHNSRTNTVKAKILLQLGLAYLAGATAAGASSDCRDDYDGDHCTMQQRAGDCLLRCLSLSVVAFGPHHPNVGKAYQALARYSMVADGNQHHHDHQHHAETTTTTTTNAMNYLVRALDIFSQHKDCIRVVDTLEALVETCVMRQDKVGATMFGKRREQLLQQPKVQQFFWNCPGLLESAMAKTSVLRAKVASLEQGSDTNAATWMKTPLPFVAPSNTRSGKVEPNVALSVRATTQAGACRSGNDLELVSSNDVKLAFSRFHAIATLPEEI